MITSTPVARWTWGRDSRPGEEIAACFHDLTTAWAILAGHRLVSGNPRISVSVSEAGRSNSYLFKESFEVGALRSDTGQRLTMRVKQSLRPGEIGSAYANLQCPGVVIDGVHEIRVEKLFMVGSSAFLDYVSTELATFSDAWMPYDLKGRAQPSVHASNSGRLSAALQSLSEELGSETDPDDPTCFGRPTETGVENFLQDDGTPTDVWSSFEIPYRYSDFTHAPGFGRIGYKRTAEGEVEYVPVLGAHGVLGYLWASDAENAASFEPHDVGDDETYHAGLHWLDRLRAAHDQGLAPSEALQQLTDGLPEGDHAPGRMRLDALRELAADL